MSAVIMLMPNPRALQAVRNAINERARSLGSDDDTRHAAVSKAFTLIKLGSSSAWAVAEACRMLRGTEPAVRS